ncbi:MAG: hypothetical protein AB7L91_09580 [Dehalococcoidia bacterium]
MPLLSFRNEDARIVALAITYHLGRPGSETDPATLQRHDLGLAPVGRALDPQLAMAEVRLELSPYQLHRLDEALLGTVNELKQYDMSHRRSAVPNFETAIGLLFPELTREHEGHEDVPGPLDLVTRIVMLRRRLDPVVRQADADLEAQRAAAEEARRQANRRWWKPWQR